MEFSSLITSTRHNLSEAHGKEVPAAPVASCNLLTQIGFQFVVHDLDHILPRINCKYSFSYCIAPTSENKKH